MRNAMRVPPTPIFVSRHSVAADGTLEFESRADCTAKCIKFFDSRLTCCGYGARRSGASDDGPNMPHAPGKAKKPKAQSCPNDVAKRKRARELDSASISPCVVSTDQARSLEAGAPRSNGL